MAKKYRYSYKSEFSYPCLFVEYSNSSITDTGLDGIDEELRTCEEIASSIIREYSSIDRSISEFRKSYRATSDTLFDIGDKLSAGLNEKNVEKFQVLAAASLVTSGAGLLVRLGGAITAGVREYQAYKQKRQAEDILLEKKKEIASEKIDSVIELRNYILNGTAAKARLLFEKEGDKEYDPTCGELQIKIYKKLCSIILRYNHVIAGIDTIINEMRAWLDGRHNGKRVSPASFEDEVGRWSGELELDDYFSDYLSNEKPIPVKIALVMSEPALVRQFLGVEMASIACQNPLIEIGEGDYKVPNTYAQSLLSKNDYIIECRNVLELYGYENKAITTKMIDFLTMALYFLAPMAIMLVVCLIVGGTFWRIFIGGAILAFVISNNLDVSIALGYPVEKKLDEERQRYIDYIRRIYDRELKIFDKYTTIDL